MTDAKDVYDCHVCAVVSSFGRNDYFLKGRRTRRKIRDETRLRFCSLRDGQNKLQVHSNSSIFLNYCERNTNASPKKKTEHTSKIYIFLNFELNYELINLSTIKFKIMN